MSAPLTFWSQPNPYTQYVRCELPANELGCRIRGMDSTRWAGVNFSSLNEGVAIHQLVANAARLHYVRTMMNDGIPCYAEVDDDYTKWDEAVANSNWRPDMPTDPYQASVELHRRSMTLFEGVICATDRLAEVYSKLNPNVYVCRNSVNVDDWRPRKEKDPEAPFKILWMASASHRIDQQLVLPALEWAAKQPNVEVYLFGPVLGGSGDIIRIPWQDDPQAYRDKMIEINADVGLCVLRQTDFSIGKSDLKALEYSMAGALPIVSPLEPYYAWSGKVLHASSSQEWYEEIKWCIDNRDEVHRLAEACYEYTVTERSIQKEAPKWLEAVNVQSRELVMEGVR